MCHLIPHHIPHLIPCEACEYVGETYIQSALNEIETLKGYGPEGKEGRKALVKVFKDSAAGLPDEGQPAAIK